MIKRVLEFFFAALISTLYLVSLLSPWVMIFCIKNNREIIEWVPLGLLGHNIRLLNLVALLLAASIVIYLIGIVKKRDKFLIVSVVLGFLAIISFVVALFDGVLIFANKYLSLIISKNQGVRGVIMIGFGAYIYAFAVFLNAISLLISFSGEE